MTAPRGERGGEELDPAERARGDAPEPVNASGPGPGPGGLCPVCPHVRRIVSDRGSVFLLCTLAREDPTLPRYPPQPRLVCRGFPAG